MRHMAKAIGFAKQRTKARRNLAQPTLRARAAGGAPLNIQ